MAEAGTAPLADDGWQEAEEPGPQSQSAEMPHLSLEGFAGPLDFLLEMVRRHQLDLSRLSIIGLADQLVAALESSAARLERRADWLVMATELLRLRAQLIAPATPQAAEEAQAEADRRLGQLEELAVIKAAAAWLSARPQLGHDVFARGIQNQVPPKPQSELYVAFLEATLVMLEGRESGGAEAPLIYRPNIPQFWRVPDALERIHTILEQDPEGGDLTLFLPPLPHVEPEQSLQARAALASTLMAGLELARDGVLNLSQEQIFGPIRLRSATHAK
ncbi:ScpA family protein [Roseomonas mucosa]|uniref:segregation and condensation protein A n=1 Tax=Roseomonas mucosa TaxID=207340 RepID=UPI0028CF803B|nr:ScpA family protein [Roseomonas mucosa]MDT8278722.1 ScpA family protein [Roseomonas mucosa]